MSISDEQLDLINFITKQSEQLVIIEASLSQARMKLQQTLKFDDKKFSNAKEVIEYMRMKEKK